MAVEPLGERVSQLIKDVIFEHTPSFTHLVNTTVSSIKAIINNIPEDFQVTADIAPGFVRDVGADKVEFRFKRPESIQLAGSYSLACIVRPDINVDLLLRLPKECFLVKDNLNHRYHAKRFLYLCIVKKYLESSSLPCKVEWSSPQCEARKPILVIYSDDASVPGFSIRIIPTASSLFKTEKLIANRNNVRALNQEGVFVPTPKYNSSILEDIFIEEVSELTKGIFHGWEELGKALALMKVWARQRSSIYSHDCLNGHLITVIMSYLAQKGTGRSFNKSMSAMQIFRVTLDFIANSKTWETGLVFQSKEDLAVSAEELKDRIKCLRLFPVLICDRSASLNFAFRMSKSSFLELQSEAALTLNCIGKCRDFGFEEVFLTKCDFAVKYDYCIRLNLKGASGIHQSSYCVDDECWRLYEEKVRSLLYQGLSDRANFVRVIWRNWPTTYHFEDGFSSLDKEPLLIGITLSSVEKAFRQIDIGPSPEDKVEAAKFRKFWGEKCELRRFKDGTIAEAACFECLPVERHLIVKKIIEHILSRHLSLLEDRITVSADQLDFSLCSGSADPVSLTGDLIKAYETLAKHLRLLDEIPLRVSSVQPLDPAFRFTSVFPPEPHGLAGSRSHNVSATCVQPVDILIQLEGSGNWPMDEVATEKTKAAFLLKIAESLQSKHGVTCVATEDNVDVLLLGYAFRLKILHERGLSLVKRQGNQFKRVSSIDKQLFVRSQHSSMINGLQGRFPIYGAVVRLAKRWAASHLFSACLGCEVTELLAAHLFLNPLPFRAPNSRVTGFLRFLRLLSEYDWNFSPLVVDINNDLTTDDLTEINENFMSSRKAQEANPFEVSPAIYMATTYDKSSEAWTDSSPNTMELKRLVAYARSSANLLTRLVGQDQCDSNGWECLFRTPLNNYDAVVLLHRNRLAYPQHLLFPSEVNEGTFVARGNASKEFSPIFRPKDMKGRLDILKTKLMVDFDPLKCYVVDLQGGFPDTLKLWYDALGGDAIGITWTKSTSKKRDREEDSIDGVEVLKAVGEAGKGFVRSVHLLKAPRLGK
ncbi:uncharacterized protein LOC141648101 isoform X2 [Silene latifolia]|uniref:uncharacterized protein LOC141648101 isoform X2 n=1 Tax=Silene latifolia TaxID=37657 RepID=UPI003D78893D